ncbi:TIR domain-containing protein [Vibrio cholerae]|nr:TIR domain-containing protein [Vibrio parahaemolyticus]ELM3767822.1 TIR domain-containing protein [Vibrio cholerae]HDZ2135099.1 TIR domain-containing protein [Vibrio cholerae]HDZ2385801.1 TIR domain-containing protein [Vibrio cholerae]
MARKAFYSFHYKNDNWRASTVRSMGSVEGNKPATDNDWEEVTKGGDKAIQDWIDSQMKGKSCLIVLVGEKTAGRKWIKYEIKKAWQDGKGVVGIQIHKLKDSKGNQSNEGGNPFDDFTLDGKKLSSIVKLKKPTQTTSQGVYNHIKENLADWLEEAIEIRNKY